MKRKDPPTSTAIVVSNKKTKNEGEIIAVESRTSNLKSPIMLLEGHQAELNAVKFSPDGQSLASAGVDKQIRMLVSVNRFVVAHPQCCGKSLAIARITMCSAATRTRSSNWFGPTTRSMD